MDARLFLEFLVHLFAKVRLSNDSLVGRKIAIKALVSFSTAVQIKN